MVLEIEIQYLHICVLKCTGKIFLKTSENLGELSLYKFEASFDIQFKENHFVGQIV